MSYPPSWGQPNSAPPYDPQSQFNQYPPQQQPFNFGSPPPPSGPPPRAPRRPSWWGRLLRRYLWRFAIPVGLLVVLALIGPARIGAFLEDKVGIDGAKNWGQEAQRDADTPKAQAAKAGDCVVDRNADDASTTGDNTDARLRVVPCDGGEAAYKVVGIANNKLQSEVEAACQAYPDSDASYWEGYPGSKGLALCLQTIKK